MSGGDSTEWVRLEIETWLTVSLLSPDLLVFAAPV